MMGYDRYKDSNGITWTVAPANNGWSFVAYVSDDADPKYDPPAIDQQSDMPAPDDFGAGKAPPSGEQQRVLFTQLAASIETYAKANRGNALLKVTAKPPIPWWVWAGILWALYEEL